MVGAVVSTEEEEKNQNNGAWYVMYELRAFYENATTVTCYELRKYWYEL